MVENNAVKYNKIKTVITEKIKKHEIKKINQDQKRYI